MVERMKTISPKGAEAYDITAEDVISSGLIPNLEGHPLQYIGKQWFKDAITGTAYHFVKDDAGILSVKETRQSKSSTKESLKSTPKPKIPHIEKPKTAEVICIDCGASRTIKVQDVFQVKRCIVCQSKFRIARRKARIETKKNTPSP